MPVEGTPRKTRRPAGPWRAAAKRVRPLLAAAGLALFLAAPASAADELPIFDAHLHYNVEAFEPYPVAQVLELFRQNNVRGILANSRTNEGTRRLVEAGEAAGLWVVPFVRPYRTRADIDTWFGDPEILALVEAGLGSGLDRGVGEFHLHGRSAAEPLVQRLVDLAVEKGVWLHAHSDVEAVEILYRHNQAAKIIWAHTGFGTPPAEVERLLTQYPTLMGELSYRGGLTEGGALTPAWRRLFLAHGDRFLVGSDTWITERWASYGELIDGFRAWLSQLPPDTAKAIAWGNAERIFATR